MSARLAPLGHLADAADAADAVHPCVDPSGPLLSVLTVTRNACAVLPATVASLRAQRADRGDVEWIVVDGASTDGSTFWLAGQKPDRMISEPDTGIYDAMNKAVALARGRWLFFLNAGDALADPDTLAEVLPALRTLPTTVGVAYGDVVYFGAAGERRRRFHWMSRRRLLFGDLNHQAAFVRRELFERHGPFDAQLRWNADFDWFVRVFRAGTGLHYLQRDIARFHDAGAHVLAGESSRIERDAVRARYLPLPLWRVGHWALRGELKLRRWLGEAV